MKTSNLPVRVTFPVTMLLAIASRTAIANPPAPSNDTPAGAIVLTGEPVLVQGTTVLASNDPAFQGFVLSGGAPVDDGPDVFYEFAPTASGTYRIHLWPWQHAPLRFAGRRFVLSVFESCTRGDTNHDHVVNSNDVPSFATELLQNGTCASDLNADGSSDGRDVKSFVECVLDGVCTGSETTHIAGARASADFLPVKLDVFLNAGVSYLIVVDHDLSTSGADNFEFSLALDLLTSANPDHCNQAVQLPQALPVVAMNSIDASANDFAFTQAGGQCAVSSVLSPTTAPGNDHVYVFVPPASGRYAIELISTGFDAVLYVDDSCPPTFGNGCLGASDHNSSANSGGRHELVVVSLVEGNTYYIYVDNGSTTNVTGPYTLIIDNAINYEINEVEPNNSPSAANVPTMPGISGGQLVGPSDEDWWAISGAVDDRVYAFADLGLSANSTIDLDMTFVDTDGSSIVEYDDEDGDNALSPLNDLNAVCSTDAPVLAGVRMLNTGTSFLRVFKPGGIGASRTVHRYRMHIGIEPAARQPLAEIEPNNVPGSADFSPKCYYAGVIEPEDDIDVFGFDASVNDRVFIALDGDPERNGTGDTLPANDPNVLAAALTVLDPAGDLLLDELADTNDIQFTHPDWPAQAGFFVAKTTGRHHITVTHGNSPSHGPGRTYQLAVFLNNAAPGIGTEEQKPGLSIWWISPEAVGLAASDDQIGDSGVVAVELVDNSNLALTGITGLPGPSGIVSGEISLVTPGVSGRAKLLVHDAVGNTTSRLVKIDVVSPVCTGQTLGRRTITSAAGPLFIPDNQPNGPGADSVLTIPDSGTVTDVNVTVTFETPNAADLRVRLVSPNGTSAELFANAGSSAMSITDATIDDSGAVPIPSMLADEPFTGTWRPDVVNALSALNGGPTGGNWTLNARDDSATFNGGSRLVRWTLDVTGTFNEGQFYSGLANDPDSGIQSVALTAAANTQVNVEPMTPGDTSVRYAVSLIDPFLSGSGIVVVTDMQGNLCNVPVALNGRPDTQAPSNTGTVDRALRLSQEIQQELPLPQNTTGIYSPLNVAEAFLVGEVEVELTIDTRNVGSTFATLTKGNRLACLLNKPGAEERGVSGLTKDNLDVDFDDDAPVSDDSHLEPATGLFVGLHQPDGRAEFVADGITSDRRDNLLFQCANQESAGEWMLRIVNYRAWTSTPLRAVARRWVLILKSPAGAEWYQGRVLDQYSGIQNISLGAGSSNLYLQADFAVGDMDVSYLVGLSDPNTPGSGQVLVTDIAGNVQNVPVTLLPRLVDTSPPVLDGTVSLTTNSFSGTAIDDSVGDSGIASIALTSWSSNLQVTSSSGVGTGSAAFTVGLIDGNLNGHGYVRVTDAAGWRSYIQVQVDALSPVCTGSVSRVKRYFSGPLNWNIADHTGIGDIVVLNDPDIIGDIDITINVTHHNDADLDVSITHPHGNLGLFSDNGGTGNDYVDTTLDDAAALQLPITALLAPFTGSWLPEDGSLTVLEGFPVAGTYMLHVSDDANDNHGLLNNWSMRIQSPTFPEAFDGRVQDLGPFQSGIEGVELLPGAVNLDVMVDPAWTNGATIVRFVVSLIDRSASGTGIVRATDKAGRSCDTPIILQP